MLDFTKRLNQIDSEMAIILKDLEEISPGSLRYHKDGNIYRLYELVDGKKTYIRKRNIDRAKELARRDYLEWRLADLQNEKKAIFAYMNCYKHGENVDKKLASSPVHMLLLADTNVFLSKELQDWQDSPFETNPINPELRIHRTPKEMVRSKSEAIIATTLFNKNVPYRYESSLVINKTPWYPDFTIRHPKTGEIYIWEHFGLVDNEHYAANCSGKIHNYIKYRFIPTVNLIVTFETGESPLDITYVNTLVDYYFG